MAKKELKYGEAMQEMEEILSRIENEELDVDELSSTVKRVSFLVKVCRDKLYKTEAEVEKILKEMNDEGND
ncbi:MAG: exodeoxyribonuclease VII small subunit [Bacteroidota bacterium]|nr:exodeoxyribonuclease VII small subunit [Bacteroidota bacterium]